jgi:hypothetical protein
MLAPVCLFAYNRPFETSQTIKKLQKNFLAPDTELFVFSDGPKNQYSNTKVKEVREIIRNIDGFKEVHLFEAKENRGLANSIISGTSNVINDFGKVIVLEDDLITSSNFLDFMNAALDFYQHENSIFSISGYSLNLPSLRGYSKDFYLGYRAFSWGWGTWRENWNNVDWEVKSYPKFKRDFIQQTRFMRGGSDMPRMLKRQMKQKIDSWAIRWCYDQFQKDQLTIFPRCSKVKNIGFGGAATHTKHSHRFDVTLDDGFKRDFIFEKQPEVNRQLAKEFRRKFSVYMRLMDKFVR